MSSCRRAESVGLSSAESLELEVTPCVRSLMNTHTHTHQAWGQIHLYLKVFKYFFQVFVFKLTTEKVFVFKYFHKVFDFSNTSSNTLKYFSKIISCFDLNILSPK